MCEDEDKKSKKYEDKIKMGNFIRRNEHIVGEMNWGGGGGGGCVVGGGGGGGGGGVKHIFH